MKAPVIGAECVQDLTVVRIITPHTEQSKSLARVSFECGVYAASILSLLGLFIKASLVIC